MIRIDQRAPVTGASRSGSAARTSGSSFSLPTTESGSTQRSAGTAPAGPLDLLIAVQAEGEPAERRKRQARRGTDLLDGLDRLKAALLAGRVPVGDLQRIRDRLAERRELTDDPRLDDVLAHIELRAAVELAKLGR